MRKYIAAIWILTFFFLGIPSSRASVPTKGKGMWIWQIWNAEGGNLGAIISRLKSTGVTWVAVKLGDSNSEWNTPGHDFYTWVTAYHGLDSVIAEFHLNGISFYGWQYVYGSAQYSGSGTVPTEADVSNDILNVNGMDGFIIDAEVEFEASGMTAVAAAYVDSIRAAHPHSFVALTSFARVTGQPIPWTTFLSSCDVNMPQAYWALRPQSPSAEFSAMRNDFESWEQNWINSGELNAVKPIVPIGCEYGGGDGYNEQYGDIAKFCSLSQAAGYAGFSLWEYTEMDTMNWRDYSNSWPALPPVLPEVTNASPSSGLNTPAYDSVQISFNTPMDAESVSSAFTISPHVNGKLVFNPDFTRWIFAPDTLLPWSTTFTVSVDTSAESILGAHFSPRFTYTFSTVPMDTIPPLPLAISPGAGGTSVSRAYFEFVMDKPVTYNSFVSHLALVDSTGKKISLGKDQFALTSNNLTLAAFRSVSTLTPGMKYTAAISSGVSDYYGNVTRTGFSSSFTVESDEASGGTVLEGFESPPTSWTLAPLGGGSEGVDTSSSGFASESGKKYDGSYAAGLQYAFDSTNGNGVCEVILPAGISIAGTSSFGMWIFGDVSGNQLDFIFGSSAQKSVAVDTINWYGWKYVGMWLDRTDSVNAIFNGFSIRQLPGALLDAGSIYFDDVQRDSKVTGVDPLAVLPEHFELFQNYPNPFNPSTVISYQLTKNGRVTLNVYDVLGREVKTLVNEQQTAGEHTVAFNAGDLPSGVYFYQIRTGSMVQTRKLVLIK